jgi:hypothetical protein
MELLINPIIALAIAYATGIVIGIGITIVYICKSKEGGSW